MPDRRAFGSIELSVQGRPAVKRLRPLEETPFRILVMGDFSGRESRGLCEPLAAGRATMIDVDNLQQVLARLNPELELSAGETGSLQITISTLDDFHPDQLLARLPLFQTLRATHDALRNPATARATAAALTSAAAPLAPETQTESVEETLHRLLGPRPEKQTPRQSVATANVEALLKQIVAPHIVPSPEPSIALMSATVESAIGAAMRVILHQPAFQKFEAAWRGLDFLVRTLETDETLQLFMLDVSHAELAADLRGVEDLARSVFFKRIVEETVHSPGGIPWAVIVGNYTFGASREDVELLARIAKIAAAADAPFLAGAGEEFVQAAIAGQRLASEAWPALRVLPEAASLGLAAPRFLLRLPYGRETDPVATFDFEEMPHGPVQDAYLWSNGAVACACLLAQSFRENQWDLTPGDVCELSGLPVHTFRAEGEIKMAPCAEQWLTDRHAENLLTFGIMPLMPIRGRDAVRLPRFQSVADPPTEPAGQWS